MTTRRADILPEHAAAQLVELGFVVVPPVIPGSAWRSVYTQACREDGRPPLRQASLTEAARECGLAAAVRLMTANGFAVTAGTLPQGRWAIHLPGKSRAAATGASLVDALGSMIEKAHTHAHIREIVSAQGQCLYLALLLALDAGWALNAVLHCLTLPEMRIVLSALDEESNEDTTDESFFGDDVVDLEREARRERRPLR